jgi:uncharacterized SAM-binding protein YcdF (DUF218 family)
MFFVLSKTLNYLTMPFSLVVICLIASLVVTRHIWKRRLFLSGLFLLLFFSNEFLANECMRAWEIQPTPFANLKKHRIAIVLTGATLDKIEPNDRVYFQRGADRVYHTVQLYKMGLIEKILVSGGSGSLLGAEVPEADRFREAMRIMGVPDSVIILENKTRNTHESAVSVKQMLLEMGYENTECLLVTSAFHMRRSMACYRKVGLNPIAFSADVFSHPREFHIASLIVPQLDAMVVWHKLAREIIGMFAYKIAGYI